MADHRLRQIDALVVGAGAVGQVIGKHLAVAGVNTTLFVKREYASVADEGFELHHFSPFGKHERRRFDDFKIIKDVQELEQRHFDQVYICVSSPDLKSGWVPRFFPHLRHSIWVLLQPGLRDHEYMASVVPERYIVQGTPGFLAYHAPVEGDGLSPPGVAWWRPPFQSTLFEGPDEQTTTAVTRLLDRGGLKCGVASNLVARDLYRRALVLPFAMAMELNGWSIDAICADSGTLGVMCAIVDELIGVVEQATGRPPGRAGRHRKASYWKFAMKGTRWFAPFPIEAYCRAHFTRRRRELDQLVDEYMALAQSVGRPVNSLRAMRDHWRRKRPDIQRANIDLTPSGMVVPEFGRPNVAFANEASDQPPPADRSSRDASPRPPDAVSSSHSLRPAAAPADAGDPLAETGPMQEQPAGRGPVRRDAPQQSGDVSSTAPMPQQDSGRRHSLSFSSDDAQRRDDQTAPMRAEPAPPFLRDDDAAD
jgi:ketopantoate reductase